MEKQEFVKQFFKLNNITRVTTPKENAEIWDKLSSSKLKERCLFIQYLKRSQHTSENLIADFEEIIKTIEPFI
jgi:hypothetical protein